GRSLGLSRRLWEIRPAGCEVRLLRARLGLDSGYFSRQLRQHLPAAGATGDDSYTALRHAELLCHELDQRPIGRVLHSWGRDADLDRLPVRTGDLRLRGARLYVDVKAYDRHWTTFARASLPT